jgi:tetratricopeptide (TPR) repeat protein
VDGVNFLWYVRGEAYPAESGSTTAFSPLSPVDLDVLLQTHDDFGGPVRGVLNVDRLRRALPQLVEGVLAVHDAGKLHRDIKPSNVLVTRAGRVVLLDFGLVAELAPTTTNTVEALGTPAYMSPEQAAGLPLTQASDWYSVGAMTYQALTGRLPFSGPAREIMRQKLEADPAPPRELSPEVPRDLDRLCRELLRRDPEGRPAGREVLRLLSGASAAIPDAAAVPAGLPDSPPFIGRTRQLAALRDAFHAVSAGRAVTVAVHGSSGMGKSALVRHFLEELKHQQPDAVVLTGRCYEREAVPYKALDAVVDALSRYLRHLPSAQVEAFLPHDILALARVFPVLRQVGAVNRARRTVLDIPDSLELRRRAFGALRELLVRMADRRSLVLFIDDLQWGDVDSGVLLEVLLRPPDPPQLILIGCYRSEEAETAPLLRSILPKRLAGQPSLEMRDIVVGELSGPEARELAQALVGGTPAESEPRVDAIARESRGNPYFIEELARFFDDASGPAVEVTFDEVIAARVARLPDPARRLLEVVAVSGMPIPLGVAYRAADLEREGDDVQAVLRAAHLVRTRSTLGRHEIETYHDRIRDAVVARLPPESLKESHRRLASALFAAGGADPESLARHHLGAGDAETAAEYTAAAAAKASEALAFDRAAGLYRFALGLGVGTRPERAKLEVHLGDALANAGRGAEAAEIYLKAAEQAAPARASDLHRRAAQQLFISGHIDSAESALSAVLTRLDMKLPATHRKALFSLVLRRAQVRLRGLRFKERDETEISAQDLLRIDTYWALAVGMAIVDMVRGADFQVRHLILALRAGEPYRVARALALEVAYVAMAGSRSHERTARLTRESQALAQHVNRPYAVGLATLTAGNAAWLNGKWREAREQCERAETILRERCTGVDWEVLTAQLFGLASMFFLGEVGALSERLRSLLDEAEGRGSRLRATFLRTGFCSHVAWLAADDPDGARHELEGGLAGWRRRRFDYLHLWVRAARTDIALYSGEPLVVPESVGTAWRAAARTLDRFVQSGFIRGLDTRARRRLAAAAQTADPLARAALVAGAERHARAVLRQRTRWGDPLAHLLRAGVAATRGRGKDAVGLLESAEAGLAAADMALHAAVARRRRGELLAGDTGYALVETADAWMRGQGIRNPARMASMLAPGAWTGGSGA